MKNCYQWYNLELDTVDILGRKKDTAAILGKRRCTFSIIIGNYSLGFAA